MIVTTRLGPIPTVAHAAPSPWATARPIKKQPAAAGPLAFAHTAKIFRDEERGGFDEDREERSLKRAGARTPVPVDAAIIPLSQPPLGTCGVEVIFKRVERGLIDEDALGGRMEQRMQPFPDRARYRDFAVTEVAFRQLELCQPAANVRGCHQKFAPLFRTSAVGDGVDEIQGEISTDGFEGRRITHGSAFAPCVRRIPNITLL